MLRNSEADKLDNTTVALIAVSIYLTVNEISQITGAALPKPVYNPDTNRWRFQGRLDAMNGFGRRPKTFSQKTLTQYKSTGKRL